MKKEIENIIINQRLYESSSEDIFIVDYKVNGGVVELLEEAPNDIKFVYIDNDNHIQIHFSAFDDNALVLNIGECCEQCEGVAFPTSCSEDDWLLFIECKYANDLAAATNTKRGYPEKMVDQIISTVNFFRTKGILQENKRANAIVSFPNLMEQFNSFFFTGDRTELDILLKHNIKIRATNSATIISQKRIKI